jgi:orsellinic acid C2-O-methyltransferase
MDIISTARPASALLAPGGTTPPIPPGGESLVDSAIEVAGRLDLAGRLSGGAGRVADLAVATGTHGPSLHRLLRALACVRLVDEVEPGVFALARGPGESQDGEGRNGESQGGESQGGSSGHARSAFPMFGPDSLLYSVRTGQSAARQLTVRPVFDFIASDPAASAALAAFTSAATERAAPALVASAGFARFGTVVDVGGGAGTLVKHILRACPATRGVVFDTAGSSPAAVAELSGDPGLAGRWEVRGGDFFDGVPPGGDAYVLKSVLHDWDDGTAARILRNCRAVMTPAARLIIFEPVLPRIAAWSPGHLPAVLSDLICLVMTDGGRERTETGFRDLLAGAGFGAVTVAAVPGSAHFHRVEAVTGR